VRRTPEMLPILKEAGVVDSGGLGIAILLRGALEKLRGVGDGAFEQSVDALGLSGERRVSREFAHHAKEEEWGYCTGFAIQGANLKRDEIAAALEPQGRSFLLLGDETLAKVHIHAEDPGAILSAAVKFGALTEIEIKNMTLQTAEWAERREGEAQGAPADAASEAVLTGVVAVATGAGMTAHFRDMAPSGLTLVDGGDLMNPNVERILDAIASAPAEGVLILPNNKDAIGVSEAATGLTDKPARVLRTNNMAQGLVALVEFNPDADLDSNFADCEAAVARAVCGGVARAVDSVKTKSVEASAGDYIAFIDGEPVAAAPAAQAALLSALQSRQLKDAIVTVYHGAAVSAEQARDARTALQKQLGERLDMLEVAAGGQPFYDYIFSIEM